MSSESPGGNHYLRLLRRCSNLLLRRQPGGHTCRQSDLDFLTPRQLNQVRQIIYLECAVYRIDQLILRLRCFHNFTPDLAEFLKPSAVTINADITSKKRALEEVSHLLTAHSELVSEKDVLTSLINREKLGSTGLGAGVAIPHGRLKGLESAVAAFVKLEQPIDYDANDEKPVDLIFGLLVPQDATAEHLQILAKIAEMFRNEGQLEAMRSAADSDTLYQLLTSQQGS